MSQMPERVLLKKDEKYNTGDFYVAYNETAIEAAQDFKEDSLDNYIGYIPEYRVKELLSDACEWLEPVFKNYAGYNCGMDLVKDFRKAMEDRL